MLFSDKKFDEIRTRLEHPTTNRSVIVAEAKGEIVGGSWFASGEYALCENSLMTTVHIIAIDAEHCGPYLSAKTFMRLVRGISLWSKAIKAHLIFVHVSTGTAERLLRAVGDDYIGGSYTLGLFVE